MYGDYYDQYDYGAQYVDDERATLMLERFGGRSDMYAIRYYIARDGKKGYYVPCANRNRDSDICPKRKMGRGKTFKCSLCDHRRFYALTESIIVRHLECTSEASSENVAIYPVNNEYVKFVMIRIPGQNWLPIANLLVSTAVPLNLQMCRESDPENGGRCWIFFDSYVPVVKARQLACGIITRATHKSDLIDLDMYDNIVPAQTRNISLSFGFGTPLPLPLAGWSAVQKKGVFVDQNGEMYNDQWNYLKSVRLTPLSQLEKLLERCNGLYEGLVIPAAGMSPSAESTEEDKREIARYRERVANILNVPSAQYPPSFNISVSSSIHVPKAGMNTYTITEIKRLASYVNPAYLSMLEQGRPVLSTSYIVCDAYETDTEIILPRGCTTTLNIMFLGKSRVTATDDRLTGKSIDVSFKGTLRPEQVPAVDTLAAKTTGILNVPTAFGKTICATALIARRKVNTLILVINNSLVEQWRNSIEDHLVYNGEMPRRVSKKTGKILGVATSFVGEYTGSKKNAYGIIDIATVQTIWKSDGSVDDIVNNYGMVIFDECHHASAQTCMSVLSACSEKYMHGLTATTERQDGHQTSTELQLGPVRYCVSAKTHALEKHAFQHFMIPVFTDLAIAEKDGACSRRNFSEYYDIIGSNQTRNNFIVNDAIDIAVNKGRTPFILTERKQHVSILANLLRERTDPTTVFELTGEGTAKEKREKLEALKAYPADKPLIAVATGQYIGEGFDLPRLDTLFLTMPFKWDGKLAQYAGRLHRNYEGKSFVVIYDYVDWQSPILLGMFHKRLDGYMNIGYTIRPERIDPNTPCQTYETDEAIPCVIDDIGNATKEIVILSWYMDKMSDELMNALKSAVGRGVRAYVVTAPDMLYRRAEQGNAAYRVLKMKSAGIQCIDSYEATPVNGMLIDESIAYYGSYNMFQPSDTRNGKYVIRTESKLLCEKIKKAYSMVFSRQVDKRLKR